LKQIFKIGTAPSVRVTRLKVASIGIFISLVFSLIVLTFPVFFFLNPAAQNDVVRQSILILCTVSWVVLAVGPAIIFSLVALGRRHAIDAVPFVALPWPVMLVINHLHLAITTGHAYLEYLINFPVFIITDIVIPAILIVLWLELGWKGHDYHKKLAVTQKTELEFTD
jgi:hypothetical protein